MSRFRLWRDHRGVAALELAIIAPVFVAIYIIGVDVALLIRNRFRVDQAAVQGLQVVAQFTTLYKDDFTNTFFPVIQAIAGNGGTKAATDPTQVACAATISGLDYPPATSAVRPGLLSIVWQQSYANGTCTANKIGTFSNVTKTPVAPALNNYTPPVGLAFIVVEVGSQYKTTTMSAPLLGTTQPQYSMALGIPRLRALPPINPANRP